MTMDVDGYYGITPLSLEECAKLPEAMRQTRNNKVEIINMIDSINKSLENLKLRVKKAPVVDDKRHAQAIQTLRDSINRLSANLDVAIERTYRGM